MADVSQAAAKIGTIKWTEGDPISLQWRVNVDWSGTYICQIRASRKPTATLLGTLTILAEWDTLAYPLETLFTMTMSEANSELIPASGTKKYYLDMQELGGVTRIWADVVVEPQVSVDP
jgi:hypothetical protein